ncbi:MAG: hypothetical protein WEB00_12060 [Dehalococcoidia bacterium]
MKAKLIALRPLLNGFERQPPPTLEILRQQAEIRLLKATLRRAKRKSG